MQDYLVYLAEDDLGAGRSQICPPIPAGTNAYGVPANTPRDGKTEFLVYTRSALHTHYY